jgi:hypothetical protein
MNKGERKSVMREHYKEKKEVFCDDSESEYLSKKRYR